LLHGICRRSSVAMEYLDGTSVVSLLHMCSRFDLFDEEFQASASQKLQSCATTLPVSDLGDAVYALGGLMVKDAVLLDTLCDAVRPRVRELNEADLVRFMRGLVKLRHCNDELVAALVPVIEESKWSLGSISLANLISAFSLFEATTEAFFMSLLHAAAGRISRMPPMSVQHIFVALCRRHGRIPRSELGWPVSRLCGHLCIASTSAQVTPVQAVSSLAALARLQYRDLPAVSVLTSVLVGRGNSVVWNWAPSSNFYVRRALPLERSFDETRCRSVLQGALDSSHCVEVLQSLHWLDLHSALVLRLVARICSALIPQLHELRAREVIHVARMFGAYQLPLTACGDEMDLGGPNVTRGDTDSLPVGSPMLRPASVVERCFESLRRHEPFLESSWHTLLPFKLLCMEVETGTFGTQRLGDILNPMLFSFVDRLRSLTYAECEANRMRQQGPDDDAAVARGTAENDVVRAAQRPDGTVLSKCAVLEHLHHHIIIGGHVLDFPVDVLIHAAQ